MTSARIRVSIIEDVPEVLDALVRMVNQQSGMRCVSAHLSAEHALEHLPVDDCDVVLQDLRLPGASGIECLRAIKARRVALQFLVFTVDSSTNRLFESLKAGATGYLLKNISDGQLVQAIREIHAGGSPMTPGIARRVVQFFNGLRPAASDLDQLTPRENDVLQLVARGRSNRDVASNLGISELTVENHLRRIYEKLQVNNRTEAAGRLYGF